jgi:arylformamidase
MSSAAWEAYDRARIDAEYDASKTVPSIQPYFERFASSSARAREGRACVLDVPYGYEERTRLDLFAAPDGNAPAALFLHGGFWKRLGREYFDFMAEPVLDAGAAAAVASYTLAPQASLDRIVTEARWAFAWLYANADQANADRDRLYAIGHSAGGQLAAMLAATDWSEFGMPRDALKGIVCISGVFELEPIRRSFVNEWLRLDEAAAQRNSPTLLAPAWPLPVIAAVGALETSEFKRQSRDFAAAWRAAGGAADYLEIPGRNHYDIVLDTLEPGDALRAAIAGLLTSRPERNRA